ncbi:MFS transporter [Novosphingobium sp. G106]|uniref:MFS transporter n=1 Tax=Novosphingobium sp. G106 TaxID=2849500 RepID=UPI001C2DD59C|nr:MFS transporter [Novosphingobium sp. G106]MBV1688563.1 MFS transporter [Novosphingobium sp. G106]
MLASSLAFIDGSVTNVALPAIGKNLGGTAGDLSWAINAYLLPLSALLLIGGALGDHYGRRRMLVIGVALFTAASIGCALSPSLAAFLAFRALQGIGAALLMPNSLGILGSAFEGEARGRAVGTWAAAGAIASAIGPPLGGWLIDVVGWRSIFYLNVPVAVSAIVIFMRFVAETDRGQDVLDWRGAVLATGGLGALTWTLTAWSTRHDVTAAMAAGATAGIAFMVLFVLNERRLQDKAMMPLVLFGSKAFVGLTVLTFLLYGALGGLLMLLPYLLIVGSGYSPTQAGLALLPFSIVVGLASRLAGRTTEAIGPRWPLTIGPIVTGVGFALLVQADPQASYWTSVLPGMAIIAFGMAGAVAPLTTAVLASVDERHTGTASGFNSAISRTGGLIATSLAGAVISRTGDDLIGAFQTGAVISAACAAAAGITAWFTLGGTEKSA